MANFKETRKVDQFDAEFSVPCVTRQGVPLGFRGVACYAAVGRMDEQVRKTLAWYLDAIIRGRTVEELVWEVKQLTDSLTAAAGPELERFGLRIVSVRFLELEDPTKYLKALAEPHLETIRRAAREATAAANERAEAEAERIRSRGDARRAAEAQRRGAQGDDRPGPPPHRPQ